MRFLILATLLLTFLVPGFAAPSPTAAVSCDFVLGFKTLHDGIPNTVGDCLENERHDLMTGDGFQRTAGGLLFWRKADSHTAFTDGYRTWVQGPYGPEKRLNTERFQWEAVQQLRNLEYTLPDTRDIRIRLIDGVFNYNSPPQRIRAGLISEVVAIGDLNSDGVTDAVATVFLDTGGSGTFIYLVPLISRDGALVQVGQELLGDRVKLNSVNVLADGTITVDMIVHGPQEPLCCPTQRVVKTFKL